MSGRSDQEGWYVLGGVGGSVGGFIVIASLTCFSLLLSLHQSEVKKGKGNTQTLRTIKRFLIKVIRFFIVSLWIVI